MLVYWSLLQNNENYIKYNMALYGSIFIYTYRKTNNATVAKNKKDQYQTSMRL